MNIATGIAEGLGKVAGGISKVAVGAVSAAADALGGGNGAVSAPEMFQVTFSNVTITALGDTKPGSVFHPMVGLSILERDYSTRQKIKAEGVFAFNQPLAFSQDSFSLKASLTSETLCIEIWDDKLVDIFEGRACVPLCTLAGMAGGGVGRQNVTVEIPDASSSSSSSVHAMLGSQHPKPGFRARAQLTLVRLQPGALVYATPTGGQPPTTPPLAPTTQPSPPLATPQ